MFLLFFRSISEDGNDQEPRESDNNKKNNSNNKNNINYVTDESDDSKPSKEADQSTESDEESLDMCPNYCKLLLQRNTALKRKMIDTAESLTNKNNSKSRNTTIDPESEMISRKSADRIHRSSTETNETEDSNFSDDDSDIIVPNFFL